MKNYKLWTNLTDMLKDIKNYPAKVKQNNLPLKNIFGYKSTIDNKTWFIKPRDINTSFGDATVLYDGLFETICTENGRSNLLNSLNKGKREFN